MEDKLLLVIDLYGSTELITVDSIEKAKNEIMMVIDELAEDGDEPDNYEDSEEWIKSYVRVFRFSEELKVDKLYAGFCEAI